MSDLPTLALLALFGLSLWGEVILCAWLQGGEP